jgi:hypothetical protein
VVAGAAVADLVLGFAAPLLGTAIGAREHRVDLARERTPCSPGAAATPSKS